MQNAFQTVFEKVGIVIDNSWIPGTGIVKVDYDRLEGETLISFGESINDVAFFDSCIVVHYFEINKPFPKSFIVTYDYDGNVLDSI